MTFQMKPTYQRILLALRDGNLKDHDTICIECGFDDDTICTGAISMLRRNRALERIEKKYRITDKGRQLLQSPPLPSHSLRITMRSS